MRRIAYPLIALAVLISGCGDAVTEPGLSPDAPEFARATGFPVVIVKADAPEGAQSAGAPVVSSLAEAVEQVQAGGRIKVMPGTYLTETVVVDKPVSLESIGNGTPLIRNESTPRALSVVNGGSLSIQGLAFENAYVGPAQSASVWVTGDGAVVGIQDASFDGGLGTAAFVFLDMTEGSSLSVERSSFTGGFYGMFAAVPTLELTGSTFGGHRGIGLSFQGHGAIENNSMTDCGAVSCIEAIGGATGAIANNALSNGLTGDGPVDEGGPPPFYAFRHHVIAVFSGSDVAITGNEIDGCGWGQCITTGWGGTALIENNTITAYASQGTRIGIVAGDGAGGESPNPADGGHAVVRNNTFVGVGAVTDRGNINQYAFRLGAMRAEGVGATLVAEGNTVTNANEGINARAGGTVTGSGNVMSLLRVGAAIHDSGSTMDFRGNDITDYVQAIQQFDNSGSTLTCNYWGASGPLNVTMSGGQGSSLYTPWATAPIAASGETTGCTGGAGQAF